VDGTHPRPAARAGPRARRIRSSPLTHFLDHLHAAARRLPALRRLAIVSRILLAMGFIPTGMVKLLGRRFTTISVDTPIGAFFEAMYQSGYYWNFIGLGQVVAGVLILIPVTSTLGAVMFFPIILNITVLTWSLQFPGTVYITALMLLANFFLLCWDYDRWQAILVEPRLRPAVPARGASCPCPLHGCCFRWGVLRRCWWWQGGCSRPDARG
jgi:uncharacterized membrane protein YphA (DoxX/SURF4 family)